MRTVMVAIIGVSSLLFVINIQRNINEKNWQQQQIDEALRVSMFQTLQEVSDRESDGITNQNEMMAAFLQSMIRKMDREVNLTVKVHEANFKHGQMEVEAIGTYQTKDGNSHSVSVRKNIRLNTKKQAIK